MAVISASHYNCVPMLIHMHLINEGQRVDLCGAVLLVPPQKNPTPINPLHLPPICGRIDLADLELLLESVETSSGESLPGSCFALVYVRRFYLTSCHYTLPIVAKNLLLTTPKVTHTNDPVHNEHGPNDCWHWLPSLCNYVPIVYFLAAYLFQRNSMIIVLFSAKVR